MDQNHRFRNRYTVDVPSPDDQNFDGQVQGTIIFDRPKLDQFKSAYRKAVRVGCKTFTFEGNQFLVSYARYLIEYLESRFSGQSLVH